MCAYVRACVRACVRAGTSPGGDPSVTSRRCVCVVGGVYGSAGGLNVWVGVGECGWRAGAWV